jgi:DNA-binding NtrC family response regulator
MTDRHHRERGAQGQADLETAAIEVLKTTDWPGNLRQLDNVVRRAYAVASAQPGNVAGGLTIERKHVLQALGPGSQPGRNLDSR